jgi:transposase
MPLLWWALAKLGETITESLESVPRLWKVIQTVREKFVCRACETISQPPAPFHPIARGRAGPNLLAMILDATFSNHQPLNRQSEMYAREGIDLDVSTLADWVGACSATLSPLVALIRDHVLTAERIHGDDTTVPVLAKGKTITGRLWTYVAMIDQSVGWRRRPQYSTSLVIGVVSIRAGISPDIVGSCRQMPMLASASYIAKRGSLSR